MREYDYPQKEYVPYAKTVTINEHRATTDESLRLLQEFENKAKANLINKVEAKDNVLGAPIFYFQSDMSPDLTYIGKFKLNNNEIKFNGKIDRFELSQSRFGSDAVEKFVADKISEVISTEIIRQLHMDNINFNRI